MAATSFSFINASPNCGIIKQAPSPRQPMAAGSVEGRVLRKIHVGERFLLRHFRPHSMSQMYSRNWKKPNGETHHANLSENRCDIGRYRRNRGWQRGSSRSVVRLLSSSLLPSSLWLLSSVPPLWVLPSSSPLWVLPVPSSLLGLLIGA